MRSWPVIMMACLGLMGMGEALAQGAPKAPAAASPPAVVQPPSPPAVRPPADREAMVQNETGIAMRELYVMPSGSADPGPDRLGADTLPAGASLRIRLGRQRGCNFDFRAVLADGSTQERQRIDLCRVTRVVMGDPTAPVREFEIANDTDLSVRELYVFPPGSSERGPDRLGADMIGAGARFKLSLGRTRDCVVTVRAIYEDDSTEDRERVNICTQRVVGFGDASIPMRQVTVENGGTDTIRYLYAIPSTGQTGGETNWRGDRLGSDVIEAGQSFTMRIRSASCRIDVRATYGDDQAEEKRGVDICQTPRVRFDGSDIPRLPTREVVLLNRHDSEIEQLYVSPANESDWGPDRLDDEVLARGGRRSVTLQADCQVDIRIVFPNGSAEERRGINVCQLGTVTLRRGWTLSNQVEDGGPADPSAPPAQGSVRLRNAAGVPMVELYTPSASKSGEASPRGDDRLGATVLGAGEVLDLMPPEGGGCIVDLTAIFRDGQTATRPGFDLCAGTEVSLP